MPHPDETLGLALPSLRAPAAITVGASPFTSIARSPGTAFVQGGTVTLIELGRGGVFTNVGVVAGAVPLSTGDSVRVTYSVLPTMTFIAR
jgi:hypothetical protein